MPLNLKSVANGSVILNPASTATDKTITLPATDGTMLVQDGTNTTTITNLAYTGTLTGGTGVINIGSGQLVKDAAGNLGLGVTPSAWGSGLKMMDFGSGTAIGNASSGVSSWFVANGYYDTAWKYKTSNPACLYTMDGLHKWSVAPSGTAGAAITFTQAMTLTAAGDLGVGTTSPAYKLQVVGDGSLYTANDSTGSTTLRLGSSPSMPQGIATVFGTKTASGTGYLSFATADGGVGPTERARIDSSGNLLVGTQSPAPGYGNTNTGAQLSNNGCTFSRAANDYVMVVNQNTAVGSDYYQMVFRVANVTKGTIISTSSATSYNTSSDYRLKNVTGNLTNSGSFIDALKPKVGTWIEDGSPFVGFLAHEFQEVSPSSVSGNKDAVDKDGNPVYQSMQASSSEVMANIIAELQSLRKRVAELEAA